MEEIRIRAVVFFDHAAWVAQCLEYDIAAQAPDLAELHRRLKVTLEVHLEEAERTKQKPFDGLAPAPESFFVRYEQAVYEHRMADPPDLGPVIEARLAA